jgi:hypothetical protein
MKALGHTHKEQSRRDAQVRGGDAYVTASCLVGTTTLATLFTAKIKPHWVSGGLPKEGNP